MSLFERIALAAVHRIEPERAHRLALHGLRFLPQSSRPASRHLAVCQLEVEAFGLNFSNPLGMAAGFDKNADSCKALWRLGFGHVEIGTITPRPQTGNPRPRLFRLTKDQAIINRLGFNGQGHQAVAAKVHSVRFETPNVNGTKPPILGVNLGANRDSDDKIADYVSGILKFSAIADYITINISSPNTPGLRDFQRQSQLDLLLAKIMEARDKSAIGTACRPVLLKIDPDQNLADLETLIKVAKRRAIDGMIVSNTTLERSTKLQERNLAQESGGLSGKPLFERSTARLAFVYERVDKQFPLIGVGGIDSGQSALEKIKAGASLLQIYSGFIYRGPALVREIFETLDTTCAKEQRSLASLIGTSVDYWARRAQ